MDGRTDGLSRRILIQIRISSSSLFRNEKRQEEGSCCCNNIHALSQYITHTHTHSPDMSVCLLSLSVVYISKKQQYGSSRGQQQLLPIWGVQLLLLLLLLVHKKARSTREVSRNCVLYDRGLSLFFFPLQSPAARPHFDLCTVWTTQ